MSQNQNSSATSVGFSSSPMRLLMDSKDAALVGSSSSGGNLGEQNFLGASGLCAKLTYRTYHITFL